MQKEEIETIVYIQYMRIMLITPVGEGGLNSWWVLYSVKYCTIEKGRFRVHRLMYVRAEYETKNVSHVLRLSHAYNDMFYRSLPN